MKFKEYNGLDLSKLAVEVLDDWESNKAFEKSIALRKDSPQFIFYEGPPSANGMPGIHHVMARSIKDIFCRYKTLKGFQVNRKAGWDTHGLPIELSVEKELGITKEDIGKKISIEEYNKQVGVGFLVSHAELQETDFMKQFLQYLQNLEDKEIISIQFLLNSFPESMMLCYLLVKGYLKQGEFLRAILACRYELLDGYLEETTNDDYRNAYQLWQNDVIVSLTYLDKFGSPDREYLLNLVESEETETKEFTFEKYGNGAFNFQKNFFFEFLTGDHETIQKRIIDFDESE